MCSSYNIQKMNGLTKKCSMFTYVYLMQWTAWQRKSTMKHSPRSISGVSRSRPAPDRGLMCSEHWNIQLCQHARNFCNCSSRVRWCNVLRRMATCCLTYFRQSLTRYKTLYNIQNMMRHDRKPKNQKNFNALWKVDTKSIRLSAWCSIGLDEQFARLAVIKTVSELLNWEVRACLNSFVNVRLSCTWLRKESKLCLASFFCL